MDYPAYPVYRESGIEWLGKIPDHWELKKFRFLFSFGRGLVITKENLLDEGVPCINYGEIHSKYGFEVIPEKHPLKCVTPDYLETGTSSLLSTGDFVFADTSEDIEGSGNFSHLNSDVPTFAGYHTIIARPISNDVPRYMAYLFDSLPYRFQIRKTVSGVKVFSITQAILKNCYLWLPQKTEQIQIAQFLDHKTQQIDQLIAKKQTLIDKLNEQRIALITHAVTKGLNPAVTLKDSGVEWLGEVPKHWDIRKLKFAIIFQRGHDLSADNREDGDVPVVSSAGISSTHSTAIAKAPGIVTGRYGTIGKFVYVENDYWPINTTLYSVDTYSNNVRFLWYMMHNFVDIFLLNSKKSAVPGVDRNDIHPELTVVPPIEEQTQIVDHLDKETARIDRMVELNQQTIDKLKEYRTALITAAVTGKIDLHNWQQEANHANP